MIAQIISGISLVLLFILVNKLHPLKMEVKSLVLASFFVILASVLNAFSLMVPLFGFPSLKIGFALLPLIVGGALLSPSWAYLLGLVYDIVGLLVKPTDFPFLGFTLSNVLVSVVPSLWFYYSTKFTQTKMYRMLIGILSISCILVSLYLFNINSIKMGTEIFIINNYIKAAIILCTIVLSIIILIAYKYISKKYSEDSSLLIRWIIIVFIVELFNNFMLTPMWLDTMYGIPWFLSLFTRIIKALVMVPIFSGVGFIMLKTSKKLLNK
ncbi:MAG: folate family ECF transporter S component [Erysipelotrichaceae bacterium]